MLSVEIKVTAAVIKNHRTYQKETFQIYVETFSFQHFSRHHLELCVPTIACDWQTKQSESGKTSDQTVYWF
jgi:hypothetical protein